jgi:PKD repeat protein
MNMRKTKNILVLLLLVFFAPRCKKEHAAPAVTMGAPVFYFNGTIGGVATSFNAGVNNYYMYSSYTQDTNHVYNFTGDLKETTSAANSISITINDHKASGLNVSTNIDSSLMPRYYLYNIPGATTTSTVYKVNFYANTANGTPQSYQWNFGDGQTSTLANPTHTYATAGNYTASLTVNYAGSCSSSASNPIRANTVGTSFKTSITYSVDTSNVFHFSANANQPVTSYLWDFGDGTSSSSGLAQHTYTTSALYKVTLVAVDSVITSRDTAKVSLNVAANGFQHCLTNFTDSIIPVPITISNTLALSEITITYTDANGIVYTSKSSLQPASSTFQILSVDNYQSNTNNQSTKKLHIKFTCTVYNGTRSLVIYNADAVIAVAYK